jgi:hypothetical protein
MRAIAQKITAELAKLRPEYEQDPNHWCGIYLTVGEWRRIAEALAPVGGSPGETGRWSDP